MTLQILPVPFRCSRTRSRTLSVGFLLLNVLTVTAASSLDADVLAQESPPNAALIQWQLGMQTPEFVDILNTYVEPYAIQSETKGEIFREISKRCGFDPRDEHYANRPSVRAFIDLLLTYNKSKSLDELESRAAVDGVVVPACVPESQPEPVTVTAGETATMLLKRYYGSEGNQALDAFQQANPNISDVTKLFPGDSVQVPTIKTWTKLALKDGVKYGDLGNALARYSESQSLQEPVSVYEYPDEGDGRFFTPDVASCGSGPSAPIPGYSDILKLLSLNDLLLAKGQLQTSLRKGEVAVVDIGFDMDLANPAKSTSFADWVDARIPPEDARSRQIAEFKGMGAAEAAHGIGVVYLTGGGEIALSHEELRHRLVGAFQVSPYGYLDIKDDPINGNKQPVRGFDDILAALSNASQQAQIINLSFGARGQEQQRESWAHFLQGVAGRKLLIIAAGNDGMPVFNSTGMSVYPASFGGKDFLGSSVVTVGAVMGDNPPLRPAFSSYSPDYVDLLAPGCNVPIRGFEDEPGVASGTSQAAPLVTFAAALVRHFNIENSTTIKKRLMESAQIESSLSAYAIRGGLLDLAAISVYLDVIDISTPAGVRERVYGHVMHTPRNLLNKLCARGDEDSEFSSVNSLRRVHRQETDDGETEYLLLRDPGNSPLEAFNCRASMDPSVEINIAEIRDTNGGEIFERSIALGDIRDITFSRRCERSVNSLWRRAKPTNDADQAILFALGLSSGCP